MSLRAYDLIGDVTAPAEIFPRLDALEAMVTNLRERGLCDPADDTAELLEEARVFAASMQARSGRLRRLWKAVETASETVQDPAAAVRNITAAALAYRAVKEQGTRKNSPVRVPRPVAHIQAMEPYRVITNLEQLAELSISTIVCPPRQPGLAYRKAWKDLFVTFESPKEWDNRETWTILTMHAQEETPEVWVLWDPDAKKDALPKQSAFVSVVPSRSPRRKAHLTLGYAKSAISSRLYRDKTEEDMEILQLDPVSSQFVVLHRIPAGTTKSQLPW